jgi:dephospho-CoA kinase
MKTIILTGGIGSGKSAVSSILQQSGAIIIDSDRVGREVVDPGTPGLQEIVEHFGEDILAPDNTLDRKKLAQKVFRNPEALKKLNHIIHPRVDAEIENRLQQYRDQGVKTVFIETALIENSPWVTDADEYWVVKAPREIILKRLQGRGLSESESLARMANQSPPEEKVKHGLVIINNEGSLEDLKSNVMKLWLKTQN